MQSTDRFLLVFFAIILHFNYAKAGIRVVGNGGGASEQILFYAWSRLPELLKPALGSQSCAKNPSGQTILKKLVTTHSTELQFGGIEFPLEWPYKKNTAYLTQPHVGAKVKFNSAALYKQTTNSIKALGIPEGLGLLISAYSEHHPEFSKDSEASANSCVQEFWQGNVSDTNFRDIAHPEISLLIISSMAQTFGQEILIGFGDGYRDVSAAIAQELICDSGTPRNFEISDLYWDTHNLRTQGNKVVFTARGQIRYLCSEQFDQPVVGNIALQFSASVVKGSPKQFIQAPEKYIVTIAKLLPVVELTDLH